MPSAEHPWPTAEDHDWALVRLGAPGVIGGSSSTRPTSAATTRRRWSVEAVSVPGSPSPEDLLSDDVKWTTLVPRTPVGGHAANGFAISVEHRFTHLRVNQHPDGGIARLRVYGGVVPDPRLAGGAGHFRRGRPGERRPEPRTPPTSSTHPPPTPFQPGRSPQRWTTAGRPAAAATRATTGSGLPPGRPVSRIRAVEIDTAYSSKGNSAGLGVGVDTRRRGHRRLARDPPPAHPPPADTRTTALNFLNSAIGTHARVDIYPDGGISRLRLFGPLTEQGAAATRRHGIRSWAADVRVLQGRRGAWGPGAQPPRDPEPQSTRNSGTEPTPPHVTSSSPS
ncbi:allantoicase [Streptomyces sp. L7]